MMWCQWQLVRTRIMVSKRLKGGAINPFSCDLAMWCSQLFLTLLQGVREHGHRNQEKREHGRDQEIREHAELAQKIAGLPFKQ